MSQICTVTTIKPSGLFTSFQPRSKEGEEKKQEIFAAFDMPLEFDSLLNSELKGFCIRAYAQAVNELLREAVKAGKPDFHVPALPMLFAETKREFLITRKDLETWLNDFALKIVAAAIADKAGLSLDSVKVVKKVIAYRELLLSLASRNIMQQDDIDSCIKVLELVSSSIKQHDYTDNVAQAIERKQAKLNDYLAGKADDDEEIDF